MIIYIIALAGLFGAIGQYLDKLWIWQFRKTELFRSGCFSLVTILKN